MDPRQVKPRGLYMKIVTILGCANRLGNKAGDRDALVDTIIGSRSPAFMYFKHHRRHGSQLVPCSESLIRRRVDLCRVLGLLDETNWMLTRVGRTAIQPRSFEATIVAQTTRFLSDSGYNVSQMPHVTSGGSGQVWLPTSSALYELGERRLPLADFRGLLGLLAECGYFNVVQSRIYLPHNLDRVK